MDTSMHRVFEGTVGTLRTGLVWLPQTALLALAALAGRGDARWRARGGRPIGNGGVLLRALLGTVPAALALVAVLMALFLVYSGWLYPLRPDTFPALASPFTASSDLENAWGGPTLAGAWLTHAAIALALQAVCLLVLTGLLRLRARVLPDPAA